VEDIETVKHVLEKLKDYQIVYQKDYVLHQFPKEVENKKIEISVFEINDDRN